MISSGLLQAERPSRDLFVDPDDILRLLREPRRAGRPLSARSCWRLLFLASGIRSGEANRAEKSRDRVRLALLHDLEPGTLAARSAVHRLVANAGVLSHLCSDERVVTGGISAAAEYGADIIGGSMAEGYVKDEDLCALVQAFALDAKTPGEPANVILRVPTPAWPFLANARYAPAAVVGADLVDHGDERSVRAGRLLLRSSGTGRSDLRMPVDR